MNLISDSKTSLLIKNVDSKTLPSNQRPWVRLSARWIDMQIFASILGLLWYFLLPYPIPESNLLLGMIFLFLWIFVEPIFLSMCGYTFGKWLLKICVKDNQGQKLTFPLAFKRSFLVWLKGWGMGLPLISILALISGHSDLTKRDFTAWDKKYSLTVSHQKVGVIRSALAIILIFLFTIIPLGISD